MRLELGYCNYKELGLGLGIGVTVWVEVEELLGVAFRLESGVMGEVGVKIGSRLVGLG